MKKAIIILIFLLITDGIFAATGANFLRVPLGPRAISMGQSFTGVSDDVFAIHYNPAGLSFISYSQVQSMHSLWINNSGIEFVGYIQPLSLGGFSTSIIYTHLPKMDKIEQGENKGSFTAYTYWGNFGFGFPLSNSLGLGINIKGIQSSIDNQTANTIACDLGFMVRSSNKRFKFGCAAQNIGMGLRFKKENDSLPLIYRVGSSYRFDLPREYSKIILSIDGVRLPEENYEVSFGFEHTLFDILSIRAGYKYPFWKDGLDSLSRMRAGIGINYNGILINYAWHPFATLGTIHHFSLGYSFGIKVTPIVKVFLTAKPFIFSPNNDKVKDTTRLLISGENLDKTIEWELDIKNKNLVIVKTFKGEIPPSVIGWDGKDDFKDTLPDGVYSAIINITEKGNIKSKSLEEQIIIDTTPPKLGLKISSTTFSPNGDGINDKLDIETSIEEKNRVKEAKIEIFNRKNNLVKTLKILPTEEKIQWDGKDDYYGEVVPNGKYKIILSGEDISGNKAEISSEVMVFVPPKKIKIVEKKKGLVITLTSKVLFGSGKYTLQKSAYESLDEVINVLITYPDKKISIEGHTDTVGGAEYNQKLSEKRAYSVYKYLLDKGINKERMSIKGWGETKPIAPNTTNAGRAANRRVEVIILK